MYRALSNSLMSAGWVLINSPDAEQDAWDQFTDATDAAMARYNAAYQTAVILAAEQNAGSQQQPQQQQLHQDRSPTTALHMKVICKKRFGGSATALERLSKLVSRRTMTP
jgi:hypothetical protein